MTRIHFPPAPIDVDEAEARAFLECVRARFTWLDGQIRAEELPPTVSENVATS